MYGNYVKKIFRRCKKIVVKINYPSERGHTPILEEVQKAKERIKNHLQNGWLATINRRNIQSVDEVTDGSEVILYNPIRGG